MDELVIEFDGNDTPELGGFAGRIAVHSLPYHNLPDQRVFRVDYECSKGGRTYTGWHEFSLKNGEPSSFHRGKGQKKSITKLLEKVVSLASEELERRKASALVQ